MNRPRLAWVAASVLAFLAVSAAFVRTSSAHSPADHLFVGTWRLVTFEATGRPEGAHPKGLIYYDSTGHMAAQIAPDRARPSWSPNTVPSAEQAKEALTGYVAYFGTYQVDEHTRTVTHHRESALNMYGVDLVRKYEFSGDDRLVLTPLEKENAGLRLVWERIR